MLLKLAWRNIWRNRTRTVITFAAVSIAVVLSILMMSAKKGVYGNMIQSLIGDFTGFVQIHTNGYWEDKTIDNAILLNDTVEKEITHHTKIEGYTPRIESFGLLVSDSTTKGAMVIGMDPKKEAFYNQLNERVVKGKYLNQNDNELLMGSGLAKFLRVGLGDTVVILSQGYHGASAAGKYAIKGIVKFGSPELSKQLVFLPIKEAQWLYGAESMYTNIVLHLKDDDDAQRISKELKSTFGDQYEVMDWEELSPELKNMIATDEVEGYVFMFILYMVISFGLFGTMLMMLSERKREFGVLVAVGMKRMRLAVMVWLELAIISVLGAFIGSLIAFPICAYYHYNPIQFGGEMADMYEDFGIEAVMQFSIDPQIFIQQGLIILIIASVISIFPFIKLQRLDAIQQMRA